MTMLGERIYDRGLELIVVWDGEADRQEACPSLLDDYPRGSTLNAMILEPIRRRQKGQRFRHQVTSRSTR